MSELTCDPHYRFGDFFAPKETDPITQSLEDALKQARALSSQQQGNPVAVWDANDNTVALFAGYQKFHPEP